MTPVAVADAYERDGYCFPITAMSSSEAARYRTEFDAARTACPDDPIARRALQGFANLVLPFVDEIMRLPSILEPVNAVLGPDVLTIGAAFFDKEPNSPQFVSWHQDLTYWGLDDVGEVTAWVALTPAAAENGCMRFVPGSHRQTIVEHRDTDDKANMLSRGQELAIDVDESNAVDVVLQPGEMSLHHGHMFHSSLANRSDEPRIGLALRYVSSVMRQTSGTKTLAHLVSGEDHHGHFELVDRPRALLDPRDIEIAGRAMKLQDGIRIGGVSRSE